MRADPATPARPALPRTGVGQVTTSARPLRGRGEQGQVGGLDALVFGVVVFVLGVLVIANSWGVIDAKLAASSAASDAARAYVQLVNSDPAAAAGAAAAQAITDSGRSAARMNLTLTGAPTRCGAVLAVVRYRVPVVIVPLLGGFGDGFTVEATHAELLDPYRSGLSGEATCAAA